MITVVAGTIHLTLQMRLAAMANRDQCLTLSTPVAVDRKATIFGNRSVAKTKSKKLMVVLPTPDAVDLRRSILKLTCVVTTS
ncbi:hypothetical protein DPMN_130101 [Dreissena polymorpha]|uniref:Uncharacterized protein n=1 Tax=Dreissena polymorpha TaxID=45954 RepID=A0A9D4H741_DREPO|nr:hypothetical protein DPMN_130101 [Dreissena polymorpha]